MRVIVVSHTSFAERLGGAERSLLGLLPAFRARGIETLIVAHSRSPLHRAAAAEGVETRSVQVNNSVYWPYAQKSRADSVLIPARRMLRAARGLAKNSIQLSPLRRLAAEWRADLVYSNSLTVSAGFLAAKSAGLPHVWHLREVSDSERCSHADVGWPAYRAMLRSSERCIAISECVRRNLFPRGGKNVTVIHNGILTERELEIGRRRLEEPQRPVRRFVIIGGISAAKGQGEAIRALAAARQSMSDLRLTVVGHGDAKELLRIAGELGVSEAVEISGYSANPWQPLSQADALLMCSRNEPFGRVTVEAMAAGVPVIGLNGGATPEIIADGETGLLYDGTPEGLAERMVFLAERSEVAGRIAKRAWREAAQRFTIDRCADQVCEVFESAMSERRRERRTG